MPEPKKKSKMISVRLSMEEYESLKAIFPSLGVRSVSEFARDAMQRLLHNASNGDSRTADLDIKVRVLDTKLTRLQGEVSQLSRMVGRTVLVRDEE
jgi:hypothetical protein